MACEIDYIDCDNNDLSNDQLFRLLLAKLPSGQPAFRVCDSAGGGGALPIGNFVFVNPLGDDATGVREDFHFPFKTLNAAKLAALPGDTIYVYGGTYNEANQLHKDGVKWHFVGKPILNLFAGAVWSDGGIDTIIEISGDAIIKHLGIGSVMDISGLNTVINVSFYDVIGSGQKVFKLTNGKGIVNIEQKLEVNLVNRCIQFGGNARYVFNVDDIFCNSFLGGASNAIDLQNQLPVFDGYCIVNARIIRSDRANGATVSSQYGASQGTLVINVTEKVHRQQGISPAHEDSAIQLLSGNIIVNGDIDGGTGHAINMETNTFIKSVEHNGNAINDGTTPLVGHGDDVGFWASGRSTVKLNGKYESSNEKVIKNGTGTPGTPQKMIINGEIISKYNNIGNSYGLFLEANAGATLLENVKIVSDNQGTAFGIGAAGARDVKIIHNVSSNVDVDVNITNVIAGTNYIFDVDIE